MTHSSLTPAFAIVPAAGRSVRMGRPKLLLPWGNGIVFDAVLDAWRASDVTATVVVVHPEDEAIAAIARKHGALVVIASNPPPEMKASVHLGLQYVRQHFEPASDDLWLLAPADMPGLTPAAMNLVMESATVAPEPIVVPTYNGQRGHPVSFRWSLADKISSLAADEGINALLKRHAVKHVETPDHSILSDLDTPADYSRYGSSL